MKYDGMHNQSSKNFTRERNPSSHVQVSFQYSKTIALNAHTLQRLHSHDSLCFTRRPFSTNLNHSSVSERALGLNQNSKVKRQGWDQAKTFSE